MDEMKGLTVNIRQGELTFFADLSRDAQCW